MKNPGVPYGTAPGFWCLLVRNRASAQECANAHSFFSGSVLLRYGYLPRILQWLQ